MSALLEVIDLSKDFTTRSGLFRKKIHQAVKPVSFSLEAGQTIGFIGQNGCEDLAASAVLAFASVAILIPIFPAKAENIAPNINAGTINQ